MNISLPELIFGGTSGTGGRVNFFVSCVNFLKKQRKMLYDFNPKFYAKCLISVQVYTYCVNLCATFAQYV